MKELIDYIDAKDLEVFSIVDDPKVATKILVDFRKANGQGGLELPSGIKKL